MEISHPASDAMHEVLARACSTGIDSAGSTRYICLTRLHWYTRLLWMLLILEKRQDQGRGWRIQVDSFEVPLGMLLLQESELSSQDSNLEDKARNQ